MSSARVGSCFFVEVGGRWEGVGRRGEEEEGRKGEGRKGEGRAAVSIHSISIPLKQNKERTSDEKRENKTRTRR